MLLCAWLIIIVICKTLVAAMVAGSSHKNNLSHFLLHVTANCSTLELFVSTANRLGWQIKTDSAQRLSNKSKY